LRRCLNWLRYGGKLVATILAESGIRIVGRVTVRAQGLELLAAILAKLGVGGILEGTVGTIHLSFRQYTLVYVPTSLLLLLVAGLFCSDVQGLREPSNKAPGQEVLNSSKSRFIVACRAGLG
jgi:hypothetical protein